MINDRTTNWCVVPWATVEWARVVHPELDDDAALAKLWEQLVYMLRLDEDDAAAAWRERRRRAACGRASGSTRAGLDSMRFEGPGTDLTVGLLPTSRFAGDAPGIDDGRRCRLQPEPADGGGVHDARPDARRRGRHGDEAARPRRHARRAGCGSLRGRPRRADRRGRGRRCAARPRREGRGAPRLGEVALVDREGRIGKTGTVFFNTLLDENAASHLAFGNAYAIAGRRRGRDRINQSSIHIDFMIGSDDVAVTGRTRDGRDVPVLRDGAWQL